MVKWRADCAFPMQQPRFRRLLRETEVQGWNYFILEAARNPKTYISWLPEDIINLLLEYVWFNTRIRVRMAKEGDPIFDKTIFVGQNVINLAGGLSVFGWRRQDNPIENWRTWVYSCAHSTMGRVRCIRYSVHSSAVMYILQRELDNAVEEIPCLSNRVYAQVLSEPDACGHDWCTKSTTAVLLWILEDEIFRWQNLTFVNKWRAFMKDAHKFLNRFNEGITIRLPSLPQPLKRSRPTPAEQRELQRLRLEQDDD
jgi:hypothetical protein